jgi:hypothetical protein
MTTFTPTYLYIKIHTKTGLLYFGKTVNDPYKYTGSGKYWLRHIKKYGKEHIETLWVHLFLNQQFLTLFATCFSEKANIVKDKRWANLDIETGLSGGYRQNNYFKTLNKLPRSLICRQNMSITRKGTKKSLDHKTAIATSMQGKNKGKPKPLVICRLSDRKEMSATGFSCYMRYLNRHNI